MIALKEQNGKRELFVAESFLMEKCSTLKNDFLRKSRSQALRQGEKSWRYIKEKGIIWYKYTSIPNRAPHYVLNQLGSEENLIRIARFGDPEKVHLLAKEKILMAYKNKRDLVDLAWYMHECTELQEVKTEDKRNIRALAEEYFESYTWLKLIKDYFNIGWIGLGLQTKKQMMILIIEILTHLNIKGFKITNLDALQRKINLFNDFKGDKRNFVVHKNIQNNNRQIVTPQMVELFKSIFAGKDGGKLNFEEVWYRYNQFVSKQRNYINTDTGEIYDPLQFEKVSKSTIKRYLYKYENKVGIFAKRSGDWNKLSALFIPAQEFEMPKYSNSLLSIDDFQPPFIMRGNKRVWFYAGVDLASECFFTWVFGKEKNGAFIKHFYRQMIINLHKWGLGMPKEIEMESHLNSELENNLLLPGVLTDKATIYRNRPSPKKIERYIGMIRNTKARLHPNFVARPFAKAEWLTKGAYSPKEMEYEQIVNLYISYMEEHNNEAHSKNKEMTRLEYYRKNQNPKCSPINFEKLLPYLGYHTYATLKAGKVKLKSESYILGNSTGIVTGDELKKYANILNDGRVSIYYLQDDDFKHIAAGIYTEDNRYICNIYPMPKYQKAHAERNDIDIDIQNIISRYQQTFVSNLKNSKAKIQPIDEIWDYENTPTIEELEIIQTINEDSSELANTISINGDKTSTWNRI